MNWLQAIFAITQLLPGAIQAVESIHGAGNGDAKKSAVKTLVATGAVAALATDPEDAELIKGATEASGPIIDGIVGLLNTFGKWTNKPVPVSQAAVAAIPLASAATVAAIEPVAPAPVPVPAQPAPVVAAPAPIANVSLSDLIAAAAAAK